MGECVVPGCLSEANNNLSIRLRRPDTSAIWAPNLDAFVCDRHAVSGASVTILFAATDKHHVETVVLGVPGDAPSRSTEIRQPAKKLVEDLASRIPQQVTKR
jgi:RNase H-fold protein (predicted Holliday junction resolvase)